MSKRGRILIVEDEKRWREELNEMLTDEGYEVDLAATVAQTRELMAQNLYHLLILDIRMDDRDQSNVEGMELLQELDRFSLAGALEVIMLSAYGTKEQMREAFNQFRVADFIDKQEFDNLEFLEKVRQTFDNGICINLDLEIHWQDVRGPEEIVRNVKINRTRIQPDTPLQIRAARELHDLLCRLFRRANSLLVRPLVPGFSGTGVLQVQPSYDNGNGQTVVVKFGDARKIDEEYDNYKKFVQPFIGGRRSTAAMNLRRTPMLGGIVYSFVGVANEQLEGFGTFYQRVSDIPTITEALDRLFLDTCATWYANSGRLQFCDLAGAYQQVLGFTQTELEKVLATKLTSVEYNGSLRFKLLNGHRIFRNPIAAAANRQLFRSTYTCITHGDLNARNILLDQSGQTWLIDFQHTGQAHILIDVAKLDAVIRFELLPAEAATLEERRTMEEALSDLKNFADLEKATTRFSTANPNLAKAYAVSLHLRMLAYRLINRNPNADFNEYHLASLFQALNTIRYSSISVLQREHALLSASLLAEHLEL
jgi:DNA-binding response OmpR family regulator